MTFAETAFDIQLTGQEVLRVLRGRLGLTQTEFGALFDPPVSQVAVSDWELGRTVPSTRYIAQMEAKWNLRASQFIAAEPVPNDAAGPGSQRADGLGTGAAA